jgi:carboxypeptidase Taq
VTETPNPHIEGVAECLLATVLLKETHVPNDSHDAPPELKELRTRLATVHDLRAAGAVLGWDQMTYLPAQGGGARGRQLATLSQVAHEKFTDDGVGDLLEHLRSYESAVGAEHPDAAFIRVARRDWEHARRVPSDFLAAFTEHVSASYQAWATARPADDFAAVAPILEKTVEMSRQYAGYFPQTNHVADALVDQAEPGLGVAEVRELFTALRARLVPLVHAVTNRPRPDDSCLTRHYPEDAQWRFGEMVATRFGYDFGRGRQDRAPHPFTTSFSRDDVRITTRLSTDDLRFGLFATMHEAGHGMYEQGIAPSLDGTLLGSGASSGVHESQSRLWENLVGRSRSFWEWGYPLLQAEFPGQVGEVPLDTFYRSINRVEPSLIRVEADELTYNLHIMMRFDFELALLDGTLRVADLPDAWRARFIEDLGIAPVNNRDGCMQDVHWFAGPVGGAFQGYTIGNVLAAQLFDCANRDVPTIPEDIANGRFEQLLGWLHTNLHAFGRTHDVHGTVRRATGSDLTIEPYMAYLQGKFGQLYGI